MILEKNQIIEAMNDYWDSQLCSALTEYLAENGKMIYSDKFDYPPDEIILVDVFVDDVIDYNNEKENFGNIRISGTLQVLMNIKGLSYWEGGYNYIGEIEEPVLVKFSYLSCEGGNKDFDCVVIR